MQHGPTIEQTGAGKMLFPSAPMPSPLRLAMVQIKRTVTAYRWMLLLENIRELGFKKEHGPHRSDQAVTPILNPRVIAVRL